MTADSLAIADTHPACRVLGPGTRFVVWVQGCPLGCRECVSPQWIPFRGGQAVSVAELAARVVAEAADGLTISGGEPFAQAEALGRLVAAIRDRRDLSVLCYTGYTLEHLRTHGTPAQHRLLAQLDLLIDGPYLARHHADLLWRGSSNQRLHRLSGRYTALDTADDRGDGLQFEVSAGSELQWMGVPPVRGFREDFERALGVLAHEGNGRR
jgi:anaerobic ribonucleoside-triphosphate reductase activating protein